jgi:hypothetical protein
MNSEVTSILRLDGWAGRAVMFGYGVGTTVVAFININSLVNPVLGYVTLALLWVGLLILGLVAGEPLGMGWTIGVIASVAAGIAVSTGNVVDPVTAGFATWPVGAFTFVLFMLALRGRRGYAWIGFVAYSAILIAVGLTNGHDLGWMINSILRQAGILFIGTLFAIALRRATQSIAAIQSSQVKRSTLAAVTATATHERTEQNARLQLDARPALERIIADEPFTPQDLRHFALLQSTLRDGVQAAGFTSDRIVEATRHARVRGVSVMLLDERGTALPPSDQARVEGALLQQLAETASGSIIALLNSEGRDDIATIVVEEADRYRRILVTPTTVVVTYPVG